jgi:hypothetical protein
MVRSPLVWRQKGETNRAMHAPFLAANPTEHHLKVQQVRGETSDPESIFMHAT